MKKFTIINSISIIVFALMISCNSEDSKTPEKTPELSVNLNFKRDTQLKESFGKALAKGLKSSEKLREFIKNESLKQVNGDYDVIYQVIKDKDISNVTNRGGNILTIRDILLPYFQRIISCKQKSRSTFYGYSIICIFNKNYKTSRYLYIF